MNFYWQFSFLFSPKVPPEISKVASGIFFF